MNEPTLIQVSPARLSPSPTNPRKHMGDLASLIESVRARGVIEPLVARRLDGESGDDSLEIVCGERRWTAATEAQLESVPVIVRELSDDEALDVQLAENIERADLTPIEEAEAYALRIERGQSLAHIAERIGRPPAYVAQRLKLTSLEPKARERLAKGELTLGVALLLARIPDRKLQLEALADVTPEYRRAMSAPEAAKHIEETFMLRLGKAGFDRADATLVPGAGACTTCPRRTGNQVELFADVKSPDLCTDPKCFRSKLDATWKLRQQEAKAAGQTIASAKDLEQAHEYGSSKLIRLDAERWDGKKNRTIRSIIGKACPETPALAQDPKTGQIVELAPRSLLPAQSSYADTYTKQRQTEAKKIKAARERQKKLLFRVLEQAVESIRAPRPSDVVFLVDFIIETASYEVQRIVAERRGLVAKKSDDALDAIARAAEGMNNGLRFMLALELSFAQAHHEDGELWGEALELAGVDLAKIEKALDAELEAKKKPAKKTKTTKTTKKKGSSK